MLKTLMLAGLLLATTAAHAVVPDLPEEKAYRDADLTFRRLFVDDAHQRQVMVTATRLVRGEAAVGRARLAMKPD